MPFIYAAIAGHRSADAFAAIVEMLQRTQYSLAARIGTGRLTWERTLLPGAFAKPKRPRKSVAAMPIVAPIVFSDRDRRILQRNVSNAGFIRMAERHIHGAFCPGRTSTATVETHRSPNWAHCGKLRVTFRVKRGLRMSGIEDRHSSSDAPRRPETAPKRFRR